MKYYDPLGLLEPLKLTLKIIFQEVWKDGGNWDDKLNQELERKWMTFQNELKYINDLYIPRHVDFNPNAQIAAFVDGSSMGYGPVVYLITKEREETKVFLLASKSRVAPLKNKLTIPRLELLGSLLMAELVKKVAEALKINNDKIFCFLDSQCVIGQIQTPPEQLKTFVSNRVKRIIDIISPTRFFYVNTKFPLIMLFCLIIMSLLKNPIIKLNTLCKMINTTILQKT